MIEFILGIIVGIFLSIVAIMVGKRFGRQITEEMEYLPILEQRKMAEIISKKNIFDEALK